MRNPTSLFLMLLVTLLSISAARAANTTLVVQNKSNTVVQVWLTMRAPACRQVAPPASTR